MARWAKTDAAEVSMARRSRWNKEAQPPTPSTAVDSASSASSGDEAPVPVPPPPPAPAAVQREPRAAKGPSYILQHYHATGRAGGAFSWRAAGLDPEKSLYMCTEPREFRSTTLQDIQYSKEDKRQGGGPRVGPFQASIPGSAWEALPKYDFTTKNRSCAFNERMHVEWENHVDHILKNGGELPTASVVAKAGFRSCAPCCRDMLALARPTGKTFIMVDLAEDDERGTFHFVTGDKYLPVPKEACSPEELQQLKRLVLRAQNGEFSSSEAIYEAVLDIGAPVDQAAQAAYLGDRALLPAGCATSLKGPALLEVLHAEHFARLPAEYGASILRDPARPESQREAVLKCRARAMKMLVDAWAPHLVGVKGVHLPSYAAAAAAPLLPEEPGRYERLSRCPLEVKVETAPVASARQLSLRWKAIDQRPHQLAETTKSAPPLAKARKKAEAEETMSMAGASTAVPDDAVSSWSDAEDPGEEPQ